MQIRPLTVDDADAWEALRHALWPTADRGQLADELADIADDPNQIAIGAIDESTGEIVGFVELSIHPHAIGCTTRPVGYLEAWYVIESHRQTGAGRALVSAGEDWSRAKGCRELASDTWLDNTTSHRAHLAIGFEETDRLIHYRKTLDD